MLRGVLFRIGPLAESVVEAQAKDTGFVRRLSQIEVACIAEDKRVLVGEIGDVDLCQPMTALGIQPEAKIHDAVARLQNTRKTVGTLDVKVVPHRPLVGDIELCLAAQRRRQRMFVA